jgi:AcrR family transcriptional regulator
MKTGFRHKRKDGLRRQAQIMDIALAIFAEKGYHTASIDDIINAADIAKGTFYLHFEGKADIMAKLIDHYLDMLYEASIVLDISQPRPISEIKQLYLDMARFVMSSIEFRHFIRLVLREAMGLDQAFLNKINGFFDSMINMSSGYIRQAQQEGKVLPGLDAMSVSYCIIGCIKEILFRWAVMESEIDIEETITTAVDLFFRGMLTNPADIEAGLTRS